MLETNNLGGKCADINAVFVALARSAGIPARDVYGIRIADSARGYKSLGKSGDITKAQHCRAEFYAAGYGWFPVDPADVRKVILEETGGLTVNDPKVLAIRDYLFGVALNSEKSTLASFWFSLMRTLPAGYRAPFAVLYASLMYERGDGALANCALDIALTDQPEYSMAGLLRRAFTSGWPPEAFEEMRKELHPQICHSIFGHTLTQLLKEQE